jgi:polyisoprenoid-binding protein YceI
VTRKLLFGVAGLVALLLLGLAVGWVYYFSGLRTAPKALALPSPSASAGPIASSGLDGAWKVTSGSQAEYRVQEQFVGQTSSHEAVARTSGVSGGLTVSGQSATAITVSADLTSLHSVDSVAGYNVTNRDRIVSQSLSVSQFPAATFTATSVTIPAGLDGGSAVTVSVPGKLTVHGVTKDVTATLQVQSSGQQVQVAGTILTDMTLFGITPPHVPFTSVQPAVTIDFLVLLAKS